jgi:hypothetical protein
MRVPARRWALHAGAGGGGASIGTSTFFDSIGGAGRARSDAAAAAFRRRMEAPARSSRFQDRGASHRDGKTAVPLEIQMRTLWQNGKAVGARRRSRSVASGEASP